MIYNDIFSQVLGCFWQEWLGGGCVGKRDLSVPYDMWCSGGIPGTALK